MRKLTIIALSSALAAACSGPPATSEGGAGTAAVTAEPTVHVAAELNFQQQEGQVIFESVCWTCHGSSGHGDGPARTADIVPPSFQTPDYAMASPAVLLERFQASLVGDDPKHPHMQHVAKLVKPESFQAALAFVPALAYPREIPGSAISGQRIYQFRCAGCHGPTGHGDGPGAENLVAPVRPADFTTDTLVASRDWDAVHAKISAGGQHIHGSIMPPWGQVLKDADIWDLVAYLSTFQPGLVAKPSWTP